VDYTPIRRDASETDLQGDERKGMTMSYKIDKMVSHSAGEEVRVWTDYGDVLDVFIVASDGGYSIGQYDGGDRWHAVQIADFGDGDVSFSRQSEGDTFAADHRGQFVVRRTDNAGSLKWVEVEGGEGA
jgi:hypothetical protein